MPLKHELIEPTGDAEASVIFLHGLGANGRDLMGIVPFLGLTHRHIRFVFPHAPIRPITINSGMSMPGWYDITGLDQASREDLQGLEQSRQHIDALIMAEIEKGIPAEHIFLGGFSQGGALALFTGLQTPYPLAGLIVLSAYFPCANYVLSRARPLYKPSIFMAHGTQDPVVLYTWGEDSRSLLMEHYFPVTWQSYPMAHEICLPEMQAIGAFIQERM